MSSENPAWIVVDCPACLSPLKVPGSAGGKSLKCPRCGQRVDLSASADGDDDAGLADEQGQRLSRLRASFRDQSALPEGRTFDPNPASLRGGNREEWEPVQKTARRHRAPAFKASLTATSDPALRRTEQDQARDQERREEKHLPRWDREEAAAPAAVAVPVPVPVDEPVAAPSGPPPKLPPALIHATMVLLGVTLALGGMWLFKAMKAGSVEGTAAAKAAEKVVTAAKEFEDPAKRFHVTLDEATYEQAMVVMKEFLAAPTIEEMLRHSRQPGRVSPLAYRWYTRQTYRPTKWVALPERFELQTAENYFIGSFLDADDQPHVLAMEITPHGPKVDWESFVAYCDVSWDDLPKERPTKPSVLRARVSQEDYYNFEFADQGQWVCFGLSSYNDRHALYGYVRKNSDLHNDLHHRLSQSDLLFATLTIRYPENAKAPNLVEIVEMIEPSWVLKLEDKGFLDPVYVATPNATDKPKDPVEASEKPAGPTKDQPKRRDNVSPLLSPESTPPPGKGVPKLGL